MLELKQIIKDYDSGNEVVHALRGITLSFRENEFVSILGQSGCGKTTLLNIVGGLDHYTSGDLVINGKSTKDFTDRDWDEYRNHSIGFVFQSYNLIPHQNVLSNVELALTLSGVSKEERRQRAKAVLEKVGLGDQLYKKPSQMSGGQMQRVAIARALVNDPDILLADEPTGALDSATSVQIMELLKEIAKDKLVIMVTHNPQLADAYSTRIIRLLDGAIVDDSDPFDAAALEEKKEGVRKGRPSMSFVTALSLSLNNLMTKKARTFLTAFAGSIGIIGIALILSLSNGVQTYIDSVERDTLSSYPITIEDSSMDMSVMMETMMGLNDEADTHADDNIYSKAMIKDILETMSDKMENNNLQAFKDYLESEDSTIDDHAKAIEYSYDLQMNVYNTNSDAGLVQVSPNQLLDDLGFSTMTQLSESFMGSNASSQNEVWNKLPESETLREEEYELIEGHWPSAYNEVVLAVDENREITDYALYALGLMDPQEVVDSFESLQEGGEVSLSDPTSYTPQELLGMEFQLVLSSDLYRNVNGIWIDMSEDEDFVQEAADNGETMRVVGIITPSEGSSKREVGGIYYTSALEEHVIEQAEASEIVKEQRKHPDINVFTQTAFGEDEEFDITTLTPQQQMQFASMSQQELAQYMADYSENRNATYEGNLERLGVVDLDTPSSISIYANTFEDKEMISQLIEDYNLTQQENGDDTNVITYNDIVGTMMESVTSIIDMISYVLMAFVSVSLIVSSIMIGIITYISVLERTKEIGILRAIGASKKDISHVFNAEAFIIGLISGLLGIIVTLILDLPISMIVEHLTGVANIAMLPVAGGVILVLISLALTTIAGLIPSRIASKKDPVEALRSE
ncbi:ATP-binding cassette domain-containing protein [Amedibacillus dolichus]|uniref:ATP-binding cassette domain-containing protein n=1 Tax=Amedibacillus dolichus TaxID=31971 RepID=A0ABT7U8R2_9FIRM|nr:ATP-binding cassette domain-containing protein [Amedibacillus dolichus]MDM8156018.1 ATP-binding cassette domain-containing protein [Amedibacillus dolichus]